MWRSGRVRRSPAAATLLAKGARGERHARLGAGQHAPQLFHRWRARTVRLRGPGAHRCPFFLSGGQIDGSGAVNLVGIGPYPESKVRFPGSFGSAYLAFVVPRIILFREEHTPRTLVEQVDFVSAPGVSAPEVYRPGGPCALITGRALFDFQREQGRFRLRSLHPGHSLEEVIEQTGFSFDHDAAPPQTPVPDAATLALLRGTVARDVGETYPAFARKLWGIGGVNGASIGGGERIDPQRLRDFATTVLERAGVASADAALVADSLVQADLWGHQSHGVMRLFLWYARRIENGATRPDIRPRFHEPGNGRRRALSTLDGGDGIGQVMAHAAMLRAIDAAKDFGIGVVPVRRSGPFRHGDVFHPPRRASGLHRLSHQQCQPGHGAVGWHGETRRQQSLVLGRAGGTSPPR